MPPKSGSVGRDVVDKNKRSSVNNKDKNIKVENAAPRGGASVPSTLNQKQSTNFGVSNSGSKATYGTTSLPPDQPLVKPKHRDPTPPDDPTLPTKYLDITQFKAPEDLEGEEQSQAGIANANPDMNQLTIMLQQGMSIDEVAKSMNIKLDEQTFELLTTLKQQLDLASALAKQSAIGQSATVLGETGDVGKTYDYSQSQVAGTSAIPGSGTFPNDMALAAGVPTASAGTEFNQDLRSQDKSSYPQQRDPGDSAFYGETRDPYTNYDNRSMDLCNDSNAERPSDASFREKSALGGADYSGYVSEGSGYGDYSRDGVDSARQGYNRYSESASRPPAQKQYSYGSDNGETLQHSHRNSSSSSFSGGSGPPSLLSPQFRKSDSVPSYSQQHSDEGKYSRGGRTGMGRKSPSFAGHFSRGGGQSASRPLMMMDHDRGRNSGGYGRGHYSKGNW